MELERFRNEFCVWKSLSEFSVAARAQVNGEAWQRGLGCMIGKNILNTCRLIPNWGIF